MSASPALLLLPESVERTGEVGDLWAVLFDELVPPSGVSSTLQGELLRAQGNLSYESLNNGMMNYYGQCFDGGGKGSYPAMVDHLIETLLADTMALGATDRQHLLRAQRAILQDRSEVDERATLEEKEEAGPLDAAGTARLEQLRRTWTEGNWMSLFDRTERLVLNHCIAHPLLLDPQGRPVQRGRRSIDDLLQRPSGRVDGRQVDDGPGWLGLQLTLSNDGLRVDEVDSRSPSNGRLRAGDSIERIDGNPTATLDGMAWAQKLLAGPAGAPVWLRVTREPVAELVTVIRAPRPAG